MVRILPPSGSSIESVAEEYKDTLIFTAVNIDDEPELAETEAIEVVLTLLIYHSGQTLGSIVAPESRAQLVALLRKPYSTGLRK